MICPKRPHIERSRATLGTMEEKRSYRDYLEDGEKVSEGVEQLLQALEHQGWWVHLRRGNRCRYWCPCRKQHNAWVDLITDSEVDTADTAATIARRSCFDQ